jgi:hypothetical protein
MPFGERLSEARPAGATLELGASMEQWQSAQPAGEDSGALFLEENATEGRLRAVIKEHMTLLIIKVRDERIELLLGRGGEVEDGRGGHFQASPSVVV